MTKYREYALDPRDIMTMSIVGSVFTDSLRLVIIADYAARDQTAYSEWMQEWKKQYNQIGETIREFRKKTYESKSTTDVYQARHHMRKLANTMINARQYVIDRRRAIRERERLLHEYAIHPNLSC